MTAPRLPIPRRQADGAPVLNATDSPAFTPDLRGASLFGVESWKARLDGARLDGAITAESKLDRRGTH